MMQLPFFRRRKAEADLEFWDAVVHRAISGELPPYAKVDRWVIRARRPEIDLFLRSLSVPTTGAWLTDDAAAARRFGSIDDAVRIFRRKGLSPSNFEIVPAC